MSAADKTKIVEINTHKKREKLFSFEHTSSPLIPKKRFYIRLSRYLLLAVFLM